MKKTREREGVEEWRREQMGRRGKGEEGKVRR